MIFSYTDWDVIYQMYDALKPFAAKVFPDGVAAPFPEEEWQPILQAAYNAVKRAEEELL